MVLEAGSPKSRRQQGWFLLRAVKKVFYMHLAWVLVVCWQLVMFLGL
jgi:hypothetical protein